jgi:hypothetical protein
VIAVEFEVVRFEPQPTAVVRRRVPLSELPITG